ncbi:hypothetical protein ABZW49_00065 [Nonomuraea wenchangensis]
MADHLPDDITAAPASPPKPAPATVRPVLVNGEPGIVAWDANGKPAGVMACTVVDGRIVEILSVTDPERLASMDLPGRPDQICSSTLVPRKSAC